MAFRTIEISNSANIHIKNGQLEIEQQTGTVTVPIEDISQIFCMGPDIRLSTMDLSILSRNKVISILGLEGAENSRLNYGYSVIRS